jgi:glutamate dehydrogenase
VRVYNPDYERHGWQSTHTAVEVLHHDLPFLVDSVRTELNPRLQHPHPADHRAQRASWQQGRAAGNPAKGHQGEGVLQESLMYLEIDRCANAAELNVLSKELEQVLGEVRVAVADFEPMKAKVQEILTKLDHSAFAVDADEKARSKASWNGWWATTSPSWAMKSSPLSIRPMAAISNTTRIPSSV